MTEMSALGRSATLCDGGRWSNEPSGPGAPGKRISHCWMGCSSCLMYPTPSETVPHRKAAGCLYRKYGDELLFGKGGRLDAVARVGEHCLRVQGRVRYLPASLGDETHEKRRRWGEPLLIGEDGRGTAVLSVDEICCVYGGDYFQMRRHYHLDWPPEAQTL